MNDASAGPVAVFALGMAIAAFIASLIAASSVHDLMEERAERQQLEDLQNADVVCEDGGIKAGLGTFHISVYDHGEKRFLNCAWTNKRRCEVDCVHEGGACYCPEVKDGKVQVQVKPFFIGVGPMSQAVKCEAPKLQDGSNEFLFDSELDELDELDDSPPQSWSDGGNWHDFSPSRPIAP